MAYIINPKIPADHVYTIYLPKSEGGRTVCNPSKLAPEDYEKYYRLGFKGVFVEVDDAVATVLSTTPTVTTHTMAIPVEEGDLESIDYSDLIGGDATVPVEPVTKTVIPHTAQPASAVVEVNGKEEVYLFDSMSYDAVLEVAKSLGYTYPKKTSKVDLIADINKLSI